MATTICEKVGFLGNVEVDAHVLGFRRYMVVQANPDGELSFACVVVKKQYEVLPCDLNPFGVERYGFSTSWEPAFFSVKDVQYAESQAHVLGWFVYKAETPH